MVKRILSTAVALSVLTAGSAQGAHISIESVSGIWTNTAPGAPDVSGQGTNEIEWGTPVYHGYQSGYRFDGVAPPAQPVTEDEIFDLGTFTHSNYPIYAFPYGSQSLESAELTIDTELRIDGVSQMVSSVFEFRHWETPNAAQPCANQGWNGWGLNRNGCADRVTFDRNEGASQSFTVNGIEYQVDIEGFFYNGLLAEEFWTKEKRSNDSTLKGVITAHARVPEPGTLVLLGMGLLGLGFRQTRV